MKPAAVLALTLAATAASAGLFGRDKVAARWTAAPLPVNADDDGWDPEAAYESDGVGVAAKNDATDLYVLVTARTRDVRDQLTGEAGENVALWAVGADGRTREWGALLPFSHRSPLTEALRDPAGADPQPEYARLSGTAVSTSAWPAELPTRLAISARRPVWELKIPLSRLPRGKDGTIALDFVAAGGGGGARRPAPSLAEEGEGGRRRHPEPAGPSAPEAVSLYLKVRLAEPPKGAR